MSRYRNIQRSRYFLLPLAVAVATGVATVWTEDAGTDAVLTFGSILFAIGAASSSHLSVWDDGDRLVARFGWLPLSKWSARWEDIESAKMSRCSRLVTVGIRWFPGTGTSIRLAGANCVELRVNGRRVRIGTDQPDELTAYIKRKIGDRELL